MSEGRTDEAKKTLYKTVAERPVERRGVSRHGVPALQRDPDSEPPARARLLVVRRGPTELEVFREPLDRRLDPREVPAGSLEAIASRPERVRGDVVHDAGN